MRFTKYLLPAGLLFAVLTLGCNKSSNQPTVQVPAQVTTPAKRYHLRGKVVSIDKKANMANIDGEDIPGFMGAMTMPYQVKPVSELDKLAPGDAITADVVVQDDNSWLENVAVTSHSAAPAK
jgi:protein SCO1/2